MEKSSKIYIAGHRGMVGSSILRALKAKGYSNFLLKTSAELDLRNQQAVADFFVFEIDKDMQGFLIKNRM